MLRREDERAANLRAAGAQVVLGDLLEAGDVYRAVSGCRRVYFGMSVSFKNSVKAIEARNVEARRARFAWDSKYFLNAPKRAPTRACFTNLIGEPDASEEFAARILFLSLKATWPVHHTPVSANLLLQAKTPGFATGISSD